MARLDITLLGTLNVTRDGSPITGPAYGKVLALLSYLAVEADRAHQRSHVAALLWPDLPEDRARHNLRQALTTLRRMAGDDDGTPCLTVLRDTIALNPEAGNRVDVLTFQRLIAERQTHQHADAIRCVPCTRRLEEAIALYRGAFLEGFSVPDSEAFEHWHLMWRQRLHDQVLQALDDLAASHEAQGDIAAAIATYRRQTEIDPCRESAHRALMTLLWQSGNRAGALAQYARCEAILEEELGVEPEEETTALFEAIRDGEDSPTPPTSAASDGTTQVRLPVPLTRMVGRRRETEEIVDLLSQQDCRLLTITGPGGSGKTRLAIHVASTLESHSPVLAGFVPLAGIHDAHGIAPAIATALGLVLRGSMSPERQVLAWLRERSVLLVLDNLEQLIDRAGLIPQMLAAAPDLRVLVTSRERLNLTGEWVYNLDGMEFPRTIEADDIEGYDAVDLLTERVRHVRAGGRLHHDERPEVVRICQLVDGMPLALELAAAWANTLSLREIADAISQNLDFLSAANRDQPDRHRSMRAVCTSSWERLTTSEQDAWRRLSVFRRTFTRDAAEQVAGATMQDMAALINKSLLVRLPTGRYRMHGLLAQFGHEMLQRDAAELDRIHDRHCRTYLGVLAEHEDLLTGRDQLRALRAIEVDIDNIRAAWQRGVERHLLPELVLAAPSLWLFFVIRGWMREGHTTFGALLETVSRADPGMPGRQLALGMAEIYSGGFVSGLGHYDEGIDRIQRGIASLRDVIAGRIVGLALNMLAAAMGMKGHYDEARGCLEESLEECGRVNDAWGMAFSLNDLGMMLHLRFNDDAGERSCERSRVIFQRVGDRRGQAFAAFNLGMIAMHRDDHKRALRLLREALSLSEESDDQWGVATSLAQMGRVFTLMHDETRARGYLTRAIRIAWEGSFSPVVLEALTELAALDVGTRDDGDNDDVYEILTAILHHPSVRDPVRDRIATLLHGLEVGSLPEPELDIEDRWAIRTVNDRVRAVIGVPG